MSEVQDVFREYGEEYMRIQKPLPHVCKAIREIAACRTAALGGHTDTCDECGHTKQSYNSCRNRHCPKCQALAKERWILAREAELLPVPYFHVVFTLPSELNELVMRNRKIMLNLLFQASSETVRELAADPKYLGAEIGLTSILHTWGQNLTLHPHVHMIVPSGGVTPHGRWRESSKKFFIPVKVMAKLFRGKFLYDLEQSRQKLEEPLCDDEWKCLMNRLYRKDWYVYCKRPFQSPRSVLQYLGRYTHRVAISNHRIISLQDRNVTFKWRDYRDSSKEKQMTLTAHEFMRRFLLHILPPNFTKIRYYGFLASGCKRKKLALCKTLAGTAQIVLKKLSMAELMLKLTGRDITLCPVCGIGHFVAASGLSPPSDIN